MSNSEPREVMPGLTVEELLDGDILIVTIKDSSRVLVDGFVAFATEHMRTHAHLPFDYMLVDQSQSFAAFNTPYGKAKMQELMKVIPAGKHAYVSLVLPKTFVIQLAQTFLRAITREGTISRIFFTKQDALAWLMEMYEKNSGMGVTDKKKDK
ncbi:MAG: hypothetical protein KF716_20630 [Anaerolineae bacterium]|nr:hypothetical protein [Anaerolineae bacterium]